MSKRTRTKSWQNREAVRVVNNMKKPDEIYKLMGLNEFSTVQDVEKAFRKLALQIHPDKHDPSYKSEAERAMKKITSLTEHLKKNIEAATRHREKESDAKAREAKAREAKARETKARKARAREAKERAAKEREAEAREARARAARSGGTTTEQAAAFEAVGREFIDTIFSRLSGNNRARDEAARAAQERAAWDGVKTIVERGNIGQSVFETCFVGLFVLAKLFQK